MGVLCVGGETQHSFWLPHENLGGASAGSFFTEAQLLGWRARTRRGCRGSAPFPPPKKIPRRRRRCQVMTKICREAEASIDYYSLFKAIMKVCVWGGGASFTGRIL